MPSFKWTAAVSNPVTGQTGSGSGTVEAPTKADAEREATRHVRSQVWSGNDIGVTVTED